MSDYTARRPLLRPVNPNAGRALGWVLTILDLLLGVSFAGTAYAYLALLLTGRVRVTLLAAQNAMMLLLTLTALGLFYALLLFALAALDIRRGPSKAQVRPGVVLGAAGVGWAVWASIGTHSIRAVEVSALVVLALLCTYLVGNTFAVIRRRWARRGVA